MEIIHFKRYTSVIIVWKPISATELKQQLSISKFWHIVSQFWMYILILFFFFVKSETEIVKKQSEFWVYTSQLFDLRIAMKKFDLWDVNLELVSK